MAETIEIDPEGDVVLVCGGDKDEKRLRVHSALMTRAFPVFKALLSPKFREGTELRTTGAVTVDLPEDDGEAMTTICAIIHHRGQLVPDPSELDRFHGIARLGDKYDVLELLKPHAHTWLTIEFDRLHAPENQRPFKDAGCGDILVLAYMFGVEDLFMKLGRDLVLKTHGGGGLRWSRWTMKHAGEKMLKVLDQLSKHRRELKEKASAAIDRRLEGELCHRDDKPDHDCLPTCRYAEMRLTLVMKELRLAELWPAASLYQRPLEETCKKLENFSLLSEGISEDICLAKCRHDGCVGDLAGPTFCLGDLFSLDAQHVVKGVQDLCYYCAKQGKEPRGRYCEHTSDGRQSGKTHST